MAVRSSNSSKSVKRLSSFSLDKILKIRQNLSKSHTRIWNQCDPECIDNEGLRLPTLKLSHPILRAIDSCNATLEEFSQVHAQLIVSGLFQHSLAASRAIKKLCSSPSLVPHAVSLFSRLDEPDAFLCNTIIRAYVSFHDPHSGLGFYYGQMIRKCIPPNHYTFPLLNKICAELGSIREGERVHAQIVKFGLEVDLFVQNSLIHVYSACGEIVAARQLFDLCPETDVVTWNSMIDGYAKNGMVSVARWFFDKMPDRDIVSWNSMVAGYTGVQDMKAAEEFFQRMPVRDIVSWNCMVDGYARIEQVPDARGLFDRMPCRNVVSWNTMLALYVRIKDYRECLRLFDRMMGSGETNPNEATFMSVLTACANLGKLDRGKLIHSYIENSGKVKLDVLLLTSLLTMYSKCGDMASAREVFDKMPERSIVSWNSMIMGYGMHGQGEKALEMFLEMEKKGPTPNGVTFICILSACAHAQMVLEGWWYFDLMQRAYNIEPKVEHYGCMVDLLGRAGLIKDSEELIENMPMEAGPALWGALLSACRTYSNFKLGEIIGKRLIELDPGDVGPYLLLSNIYAAEGKWNDVEMVRKMMREKKLQKDAGCSLVNLGDPDSEPFVEDASIHRKSMVYAMLGEMGACIKSTFRDYSEIKNFGVQ
ncbi:PREDICTED: pentatricopeptide repeat-containing protein At3g29230-like [Nelumbo nucifera]|uniref:Pentatricopeptide repeat-containing protein At3g29230-like n=2 Tax=Nelumbo nucifera TaxID=4432 RepID=A0A822YCF7_NELNU|nr:PREDICTED: pentatricopeptide repeat-containing protein At3g29230-like [Nelumbo nucifera]DAD28756.1 TPA_asm: hypothetical protein HUJ06_030224 [Nelumbo nucifera]